MKYAYDRDREKEIRGNAKSKKTLLGTEPF